MRQYRVIPSIVGVAIILFGFSIPGYSQRLILGGKIAGQITNTFTYPALPPIVHEDRVLFGPTVEFFLARRLLLEVNTLYKRKLNLTTHIFSVGHSPSSNTKPDNVQVLIRIAVEK